MQPISDKYGLETWLGPPVRVFLIYIQSICDEYGLKTWLSPSKEICVLWIDIHLLCAEYELET